MPKLVSSIIFPHGFLIAYAHHVMKYVYLLTFINTALVLNEYNCVLYNIRIRDIVYRPARARQKVSDILSTSWTIQCQCTLRSRCGDRGD